MWSIVIKACELRTFINRITQVQDNIHLQCLIVQVITDRGVCRQVAWQVHPVLAAV